MDRQLTFGNLRDSDVEIIQNLSYSDLRRKSTDISSIYRKNHGIVIFI